MLPAFARTRKCSLKTISNGEPQGFIRGFSYILYLYSVEERKKKCTKFTLLNFISGEVTYSMTPLSAPFYIDTNSGIIRVKTSLDRENVDTYALTVTASDRDPNMADIKSSSVNVTVTLTDVNDNDPVFSPDHYKVRRHSTGDLSL